MSQDYRSILVNESARFAKTVGNGPLSAPVPSCPDWTLGELGVHLLNVQRMGTHILRTAVAGTPEAVTIEPGDAAAAMIETTAGLVAEIDAADPDDPCWNFFGAPQVKGFWFRRMALETLVHRWDAESAVAAAGQTSEGPQPQPFEPSVGADVVDEYLHVMMPRTIVRDSVDISAVEGDVHLHCTDTEGEWTFEMVDGELTVSDVHRRSAVAIRGEAANLALFAYNRIGHENVEIFGDEAVLASWGEVFRTYP